MTISCESCKCMFSGEEINLSEPKLHRWTAEETNYAKGHELRLGPNDIWPTSPVPKEDWLRSWTCPVCNFNQDIHYYQTHKQNKV